MQYNEANEIFYPIENLKPTFVLALENFNLIEMAYKISFDNDIKELIYKNDLVLLEESLEEFSETIEEVELEEFIKVILLQINNLYLLKALENLLFILVSKAIKENKRFSEVATSVELEELLDKVKSKLKNSKTTKEIKEVYKKSTRFALEQLF